jgi:two-component system chemotaxis response regulator CheY
MPLQPEFFTMADHAPHVLDVGQCDYDHGNLTRLLVDQFGAKVDRAKKLDEAVKAATGGRYDLILVNRIFDADGAEGLDFIRKIKAEPAVKDVPVMIISNYVEAQASAVKLGAMPGFGKGALDSPQTVALLAEALGTKAQGRL